MSEEIARAVVRIDPDTTGFRPQLRAELQAILAGLDEHATVQVDADVATATTKLKATGDEVDKVGRKRAKPVVELDDQTRSRLDDVKQRLDSLNSRVATARANVDDGDSRTKLSALEASLDRIGQRTARPNVRVGDIADAEAKLAVVEASLDKIDGRNARARFSLDGADQARGSVNMLVTSLLALGPVAVAAAAAVGGAMLTLPTIIASVGAGFGAVKLGFSGVSTALKAMDTASEGSASTAGRSAAAQIAASNSVIFAAERVKTAQQDLATARQRQSDQVISSEEQVQRAEESLARAQRDEQDAQVNLTRARQDAKRQLEDYQTQLADMALAQRQAALDVQSAAQALRQLGAGGAPVTELQRQQARLSYDEAVQRQKDLSVQYQRLQQDAATASQAGVEGSTQVVAAKRAEQDAVQRVADSQQALRDAQRQAVEQQAAAAQAVQRAEQAVHDALLSQQAAAAAAASSTGGASAATSNLAKAMAELSPAGQQFVRFLYSLKPAYEGLKASTQAALLPGVEQGIRNLLPVLPTFEGAITGAAHGIGDFVASFGRLVSGQGFAADMRTLFADGENFMIEMGHATLSVIDAFRHIGVDAGPVLDSLGRGIAGIAAHFDSFAAGGGFQSFFAYVKQVGPDVVHTVGDLAGAVGKVLAAAAPLGPPMLQLVDAFAHLVSHHAELAAFTLVGYGWVKMLSSGWTALGNVTTGLGTFMDKVPGVTGSTDKLRGAFLGVAGAIGVFELGQATQGHGAGGAAVASLGGAVAGMMAGLAVGGPFGAAIGAAGGLLVGLAGHFLDVGSSAKSATDRMSEYQTALDKMVQDSITNEKSLATLLGTPLGVTASSILTPPPSAATTAAANKLIQQGVSPVDALLGTAPKTTTSAPTGHPLLLAEGGIALRRPGGVPATIAEGAHDEAVIPLPDDWRGRGIGGDGAEIAGLLRQLIAVMSGRAGGLTIEQFNVQSAPGESVADSTPRALRNVAYALGL